MALEKDIIKKVLLEQSYVSPEDFKQAELFAQEHDEGILDYFLKKQILSKDLIREAFAEYFHVPALYVEQEKVDETYFFKIPQVVAESQGIIAFSGSAKGVIIGMINPADKEIQELISRKFDAPLDIRLILENDLPSLLKRYKKDIKEEFYALQDILKTSEPGQEEYDMAVVDTVHLLLEYGYLNYASDIHLEPVEDKMIVRYRIDGMLQDVLEVPKDFYEMVLSRIKVLARMRTDEHRAAQDGKLRFTLDKEEVDVRVSVVPVTDGENVVMRLLSAKNRQYSLTDLGLSPRDKKKVERVIKNPHGMILVTGPTGSGKTTSLYAVLKMLNKREIHISTIEDPVEYDLQGVSQIQVNPKTNLTFANGLRALVRQDPDIIMVGEIRDEETSRIAVNSAMTGHLVLSTLHTNDAATTLPRLLDMGVEPFLVASTINVVIAQRLVRKICNTCKVSYTVSSEEQKLIQLHPLLTTYFKEKKMKLPSLRFYKGKGCSVCGQTGYNGRIGVFEILEMSGMIKSMILQRLSSDDIKKVAQEDGMTTMMEDGIEKVLQGETTLEEVLRVTSE